MKTKHIAQQLALLITLGAAVSAHAQLLGGRGGAVGGSLGGMIGGSGSMGGQLSGMGSMAQRGAPTSSGSANGSVSGSMSRDAMKAQAEGAHAYAQPGVAHARGMATASKQAAVNGAGQAGSAIRSTEVRPAANVNASGSFDASGSASN